ncbi:extracellular calcium-sensing receptor-like [Trichosurus vulpecula]|uniref:extracellular calcium-sensing receptor-like n=1 Tax=Trichosurus vulpecula TaxID=9337 RepID=UPI00186AE140|nr:extracellular calcium-sensing receptor-like [Trichosurus vulpecula]
MARWLGLYKFPQVSYASSVVSLSDKTQFPSFLRIIPNDRSWSHGVALVLQYFGWTWVGIVAQDDDFGNQASYLLSDELKKAGICREFLMNIATPKFHENFQYVVHMMGTVSAKAIVVVLNSFSFSLMLKCLSRRDVTGKIWIRRNIDESDIALACPNISQTLAVSRQRGKIPGFSEFLGHVHVDETLENDYIKTFWEKIFDCKWPTRGLACLSNRTELEGSKFCTGKEHLQGQTTSSLTSSTLSETYGAYVAVYSIAHALQDLISCDVREGPFGNGTCAEIWDFQPWQLLYYIKKVRFWVHHEKEVVFDANGDSPTVYEILNGQETPQKSFSLVNIGAVDTTSPSGKELSINKSSIIWRGGQSQAPRSVCSESCLPGSSQIPRQGWPHCCFDCIPCPRGYIAKKRDMEQCEKCPEDQYSNNHRNHCVPKAEVFLAYEEPMGMAMTCAALSFSLLTIFILGVFVKHRSSPIVRANNEVLSYILLISLALCFLSSLLFLSHPTKVTCLLRQTIFGFVFTVAVSSIFSKTITVIFAFQATRPGSTIRRWMRPRILNSLVFMFSSIQLTICAIWLGTSPPFPAADTHSQLGYIIIECNEGSVIAFYCVLGYLGFLALGSFIVAFLARNLPDTYNEARFITFSMLVFCSVWISFLPTYQSTKGKAVVAVEIFSILASSAGLLGCIFVPKCYMILFRLNGHTHKWLKRSPGGTKEIHLHTPPSASYSSASSRVGRKPIK